jgi:branched-chain amino acid transport system substrate-binding protein
MKWPKLLAGLAVASVVLAACGTSSTGTAVKGTIKLAVDLPESGAETSNGIPTLNGVKFAVSQVKSVDGFTLDVFNLDDAVNGVHDPQKGAQNVQQFVDDTKVLGVVGPFNSGVARAEIPITNRAHLVQISPANTNQCLTKDVYIAQSLSGVPDVDCKAAGYPFPKDLRPTGTNNYFRVATTDDNQGPANSDYAYKTLKLVKVGVASDAEAYGKGIADTFTARFVKDGGTVVKRQDFPNASHVSDFKPFLRAALAAGAQGIYFGGTDSNNACVVRQQMKSAGFADTAPFLGGDGIVTDQCIKDASAAAVGMYGTVATVAAEQVSGASSTISAFKAAYPNKSDYGAYTMPAYDCAKILVAAIDKAIKANGGNMPSRQQVLDQMYKTDYNGVLGHTSFDQLGDTTNKVITIYSVKAATTGWEVVSTVNVSS